MRRAARTDFNHAPIVKELRKCGVRVLDLSAVGNGCPDALIGFAGKIFMFEIKDGDKSASRRKLTPDQKEFHVEWSGYPIHVITSLQEAFQVLRLAP